MADACGVVPLAGRLLVALPGPLLALGAPLLAIFSAFSALSTWPASTLTIPAAAASALILLTVPFRQSIIYKMLTCTNAFNIDEYVAKGIKGFPNKALSLYDRIKVSIVHTLSVGSHKRSLEPCPLALTPSTNMKGLLLSKRLDKGETSFHKAMGSKKPLVVGTIRMGFGHHRIAYSTVSWGVHDGDETVFHDLLAVDSNEAKLIEHADKLYSKGSRIASELGGPFEKLWGSLTKSGDQNALRNTYQLAENLRPLLLDIPKDTPIIATHSLVGLTAVACGFKNVINLVIDNYPQWFVIVPGALNLVQGPVNYQAFLRMGVPESELKIGGHWCPADLVKNIESDCSARKARGQKNKPIRLLIPVGGAGAQRTFVTQFLEELEGPLKRGEVQIFLNAGDHKHMSESFRNSLKKMGFKQSDYEVVGTMEGVYSFSEKLRAGQEPSKAITLFAFDEYFPAVATTDVLCRVTDVLCCKPSELAFYPVPKLMLRRVGDHEAASADRACELGDGTKEVREVKDAVAWVKLFGIERSLLESMNDNIMKNGKAGVYDGCKNAVEMAKKMAGLSKTAPEELSTEA